MVKCSASLCGNATYKKTPEMTFHRFPKDENMKLAWLTNMKKPDWKPNSSSVLCSKHFEAHLIDSSGFRTVLTPGAIPTLFDLLQEKSLMAQRTVLNEAYKGLVESMAIPAELHERNGKKYASFGSVVPIHCCTPGEVKEKASNTHHYCDVFTEQLLAPLGELAYVRLDESTAEKVFLNRSKRVLMVSSDGNLAQWRCAPTFESANHYIAGTPIVNKEGALVSIVTAKRGNHYAVSSFEGEGGYFATPLPWETVYPMEGELVYGEQMFASRDALKRHVETLSPAEVSENLPVRPVLSTGATPRLSLITHNGRQLAHYYLHGVHASDVQYL